MSSRNEARLRRFIREMVNGGGMHLMTEMVAPDYVGHEPHGDHYGPEGLRIVVAEYCVAFPDLSVTVEDLIAHGDKVVYRFRVHGTQTGPFLGIPPTRQLVSAGGIAIGHLAAGKLAESWVYLDALNLVRQLTAAPSLERRSERPRSQAENGHDR